MMMNKKLKIEFPKETITQMEALNHQLLELEQKQRELQEKKDELEYIESVLEREHKELEEQRLKLSNVLHPDDEDILRKELAAVGDLLELPAVISGNLHVLRTEPKNTKELYSIDIKTSVCFDTGVVGLHVSVTIATESPNVETIVKNMFVQEGYTRENPPLYWEKHWDYNTSIRRNKT
jgi:hypothetical protein